MARRAGSADLPLHGGRVPRWLGERMTRLGAVMTQAIVHHYGRDEMLRRLAKKARPHPELKWAVGLADALQSGLAVFLTSGAFVGIAFQPMFWYFISMSICLNAYMWRVERAGAQVVTGWRAMAMAPGQHYPPVAEVPGWRQRGSGAAQVPNVPLG